MRSEPLALMPKVHSHQMARVIIHRRKVNKKYR